MQIFKVKKNRHKLCSLSSTRAKTKTRTVARRINLHIYVECVELSRAVQRRVNQRAD